MATAQLSTLLRHIHKLAVNHGAQQRTDRQLLDDFAAHRDEAAFTALVARHGRMVLRVCRRVLGHEQDAEDAFQATFLVLARQCGSIRKREALANWLHGVAYRTAMKAKRSAARRRNHETRLRELAPRVAPSPTWDDVQAVLDEEIQRLPDAYRAAFVLFVLEGKSGPQAAAELGIKEGAVWMRLTRARQLLQRRLTRRGIELAAVLAALAVTDNAAQAGVPAVLAHVTIRSGLLVAAGESAAGVIPSHVAALAAGVTRAMFLTKAKIAVVVLFAAGLMTAAGALTNQALNAQQAETAANEASTLRKPVQSEANKTPRPPAIDASTETLTYRGRVLDPDMKPVAGAKVYYHFITREDEPIPVRAHTDARGRFSFTLTPKDVPLSADATQSDPLKTGHIVVKADGFTFAWRGVAKGSADVEFRLARDDTPIQGRILDLQGKPLAGLKISVLSMAEPDKGDLTPFLQALKPRESLYAATAKHLPNRFYNPLIYRPHYLPILPSARTDADGQFRLPGFAREQLIELRIEGSAIETQNLFVVTRAKPADAEALLARPRYQVQDSEYFGPAEQAFLRWNSFDHAAAPGQLVVGTVRDEATKAPIPGALIESYILAGTNQAQNTIYHTLSDEKGRYQFTGLPRGKGNSIRIRPPKDQPYLPVVKTVPSKEPFVEAAVDVELPRGLFVSVTATDKRTGQARARLRQLFRTAGETRPRCPFPAPLRRFLQRLHAHSQRRPIPLRRRAAQSHRRLPRGLGQIPHRQRSPDDPVAG